MENYKWEVQRIKQVNLQTNIKGEQIIVSSKALLNLVKNSERFRKQFSLDLEQYKSKYDISKNKIIEIEGSKTLMSI